MIPHILGRRLLSSNSKYSLIFEVKVPKGKKEWTYGKKKTLCVQHLRRWEKREFCLLSD